MLLTILHEFGNEKLPMNSGLLATLIDSYRSNHPLCCNHLFKQNITQINPVPLVPTGPVTTQLQNLLERYTHMWAECMNEYAWE